MNKTLKRVLVFLIALAMLIGMLIGFSAVVFAEMRMIPAPLDAGNIGGDSDFDFDPGGWDGGGWDSDYDGGGTFFSLGLLPMIAIIAIVIFIVITILRKRAVASLAHRNRHADDTTDFAGAFCQHRQQVRAIDPFFTEAEMREKVANLYTEMQHAWEHRDWEPMRVRMTDDLYSQMARQLQDLVNRGYVNRIERIAVHECRAQRVLSR